MNPASLAGLGKKAQIGVLDDADHRGKFSVGAPALLAAGEGVPGPQLGGRRNRGPSAPSFHIGGLLHQAPETYGAHNP